MPDELSPRLTFVPMGVLRPTAFALTRSNIEYLLAIMSGRLCALSNMDTSGGLQTERREASDIYHKLIQTARSMDEYKVAEAELRLLVE